MCRKIRQERNMLTLKGLRTRMQFLTGDAHGDFDHALIRAQECSATHNANNGLVVIEKRGSSRSRCFGGDKAQEKTQTLMALSAHEGAARRAMSVERTGFDREGARQEEIPGGPLH